MKWLNCILQHVVKVLTEGGSIKDALTKHHSYSVCYSYFAIRLIVNVIWIRVSRYLILPCPWFKKLLLSLSLLSLLLLKIYIFCVSYFPKGNLWSCLALLLPPLTNSWATVHIIASNYCCAVSLHAYLAFLRLTVRAEVALKTVDLACDQQHLHIFFLTFECLQHHIGDVLLQENSLFSKKEDNTLLCCPNVNSFLFYHDWVLQAGLTKHKVMLETTSAQLSQ